MAITIPLDGMDEPHDYQLVGGPFDGSSIRMAVEILEMPPKRIMLEWMPDSSRGGAREQYILSNDSDEYRYEDVKV